MSDKNGILKLTEKNMFKQIEKHLIAMNKIKLKYNAFLMHPKTFNIYTEQITTPMRIWGRSEIEVEGNIFPAQYGNIVIITELVPENVLICFYTEFLKDDEKNE